MMKKFREWKFSFLLIFVLLFSCDKYQNEIIPNVPVSFTINLNIINDLTIPGNSVLFSNFGFGGVVVYCELPGMYYAFDATCTHEASNNCTIENEGVLATCKCCGSQFILLSGAYPSKGPAEMPLKQYNVSQLNTNTLRVYN
jgi:Rieske Fe-S protein